MSFNWEVYKELNQDLEKAGLKTKYDFERHYIVHGKKENRQYSLYKLYPDFNPIIYGRNYNDLRGLSVYNLEVHWIKHGRKEGRTYKPMGTPEITNKFSLINGIDIIYWINLDRSKDRRVLMENILKNIKVSNKRIIGSDGSLIPNIKSNFVFSIPSNQPNGVYGCLLSHLRTINEIWNSKKSIALILEDDISLDFMRYWNKDLKTIIGQAPIDWDIIMISYTDTNPNNHINLYNKWNPTICSTMAYIINRKGCEKIMKMYKNDKWFINTKDHVADVVVYNNCKTYVYRYPYFTINSNINSLIHNDHLNLHNLSKHFAQKMWINGTV
jgi:GR25 family glycosyltransferase involved in LPS biosynthesis